MPDGDSFVLGTPNNSDAQTFLARSGTVPFTALAVANNNGGGIVGSSSADGAGVEGASTTGPGVRGAANTGVGVEGRSGTSDGVLGIGGALGVRGVGVAGGIGVWGYSGTAWGTGGYSASGIGVFGSSPTGEGVRGNSASGVGVTGQANLGTGVAGTSSSGVGVRGDSTEASGVEGRTQTGCGVVGHSESLCGVFGHSKARNPDTGAVVGIAEREGTGVVGDSQLGNGVRAFSNDIDGLFARSVKGRGVIGMTLSHTSSGVHGVAPFPASGISSVTNVGVMGQARLGIGIFGIATHPNGTAALFSGPVSIVGNLTVTGTKSAAVAHPDGTRRLTYALESPESWLEDFGRAKLTEGRAAVEFDPDFAAIIDTQTAHVFLTPEGDCDGLYVSSRTARGFEVQELRRGASSLLFSYRVVGRRADLEAVRLAPVDLSPMPDLPEVVIPEPPEHPSLSDAQPVGEPPEIPDRLTSSES
ncbi:MAG TPA: hypothetical protein VII16_13110 [Actinomycetes bacterium]|jgi:hypothetical protein